VGFLFASHRTAPQLAITDSIELKIDSAGLHPFRPLKLLIASVVFSSIIITLNQRGALSIAVQDWLFRA